MLVAEEVGAVDSTCLVHLDVDVNVKIVVRSSLSFLFFLFGEKSRLHFLSERYSSWSLFNINFHFLLPSSWLLVDVSLMGPVL